MSLSFFQPYLCFQPYLYFQPIVPSHTLIMLLGCVLLTLVQTSKDADLQHAPAFGPLGCVVYLCVSLGVVCE